MLHELDKITTLKTYKIFVKFPLQTQDTVIPQTALPLDLIQ